MAISPPKKAELRILTPIGMVGYRFSKDLFWAAIDEGVDAMILDAGSTDSGPAKLALGNTTVTREGYERDLGLLVAACHSHRVPILIGSAGGDGADAHVDLFVEIIAEIIAKNSYRTLNVISIYSEIPKELVHKKMESNAIIPCGRAVPQLLPHDVDSATRIVAQMGHEPYLKAMMEFPDFDIIICGRAYDPAPYAAFCLYHGFTDLGIAYHMGKIMECGALCATPKAKEALAIVHHDSFDIVPLDPKSRCTVISVAAHALYEKTRPDIIHGPGGALLLTGATYEQLPDDRTVRIKGAIFEPEEEGKYTVKLEGARPSGYHSIFIGGIRDPILIAHLDAYISRVTAAVKEQILFSYDLRFIIYGVNGIMGNLDQKLSPEQMPREVGICGHARAKTQADADYVVNLARIYCAHAPYPHQLATAGNFAMPFAPCEVPMGQVSEFCIYHIMQIADPVELFPIKMSVIEGVGLKPSLEIMIVLPSKRVPVTDTLSASEDVPIVAKAVDGFRKVSAGPDIVKKPTITRATSRAKRVTEEKALNGTVSNGKANGASNGIKASSAKKYFLTPLPAEGTSYLGDQASVVRSKNTGPYELTFDIMFADDETYLKVKKCGVLTQSTVANLYNIDQEDVIVCLFWDAARAFKATIKRHAVSGGYGETDTHGSQQHVPFLYLVMPIPRQ